jgi:hypothetical protein
MTTLQTELLLSLAYGSGTADDYLTPAQRRRVKHKQAPTNPQLRGRHPHVVIYDEVPERVFAARDMRFPTQMATRPRMTGKVREYIDARLAQNVRRAVARGR